jgi:hypothetical protein
MAKKKVSINTVLNRVQEARVYLAELREHTSDLSEHLHFITNSLNSLDSELVGLAFNMALHKTEKEND